MSDREKAAEIRKVLKGMGWNSRMVSVRCSRGGAIYVTVKAASVPLHEVEKVANKHESIRRDHMSGDILSGGNTFVFVEYDRDLVERKASEVLPLLSDEPGKPVVVQGLEVWKDTRGTYPDEYCVTVAGADSCITRRCYNKNAAASTAAAALMDGGMEGYGEWVSL